MSQADLAPEPQPARALAKPRPGMTRILLLVLLGLLMSYIVVQSRTIWAETEALWAEVSLTHATTIVGYVNISPNPSYAARPTNWIHDEGDQMLLWSGWKPGVGHGWFKVGLGEVDPDHISYPMGRDVVRAIDRPIVEVGGGPRWELIPSNALVVGMLVNDVPSVYPMLLLRKVEVINDEIDQRPFLITCTPFVPEREAVSVYNPMLDGRRVTMGLSGYFSDGKPILYDRGSESLWISKDGKLTAVAGHLKGSELPTVARPSPLHWSLWRTRYPESRLVIGADRSKGLPAQ
jgi:Protein of unknown function (DUF3179)